VGRGYLDTLCSEWGGVIEIHPVVSGEGLIKYTL